jgi:hypothetical protein
MWVIKLFPVTCCKFDSRNLGTVVSVDKAGHDYWICMCSWYRGFVEEWICVKGRSTVLTFSNLFAHLLVHEFRSLSHREVNVFAVTEVATVPRHKSFLKTTKSRLGSGNAEPLNSVHSCRFDCSSRGTLCSQRYSSDRGSSWCKSVLSGHVYSVIAIVNVFSWRV